LFHPHPFGAGLESGSSNPDVPQKGNRLLVVAVSRLFHPHTYSANLNVGSTKPIFPGGNLLLVRANEFLEASMNELEKFSKVSYP